MTVELKYLTWVTLLTALMWVPYILNRVVVRGLLDSVGYPAKPKPHSPWAERLQAAHSNAIENLIVFAPLVLVAHAAGVSNQATVLACTFYFWARLAHMLVFTLQIPWLRTLAFMVGVGCQVTLAWQILA